MDYIYVVIKQQSNPENPKSGWIWIQTNAVGNDIAAWLYVGNKWISLASA